VADMEFQPCRVPVSTLLHSEGEIFTNKRGILADLESSPDLSWIPVTCSMEKKREYENDCSGSSRLKPKATLSM
jgi:hypothetical protein